MRKRTIDGDFAMLWHCSQQLTSQWPSHCIKGQVSISLMACIVELLVKIGVRAVQNYARTLFSENSGIFVLANNVDDLNPGAAGQTIDHLPKGTGRCR